MYNTGLIVGKFAPLHYGHSRFLNEASKQCRKLIVLSWCDEKYGYPNDWRETWIKTVVPDAYVHVVDGPCEDATDWRQREFASAYVFQQLETTVQAVFTGGENYGDGFADHLSRYFSRHNINCPVKHVNLGRKDIPISATMIRNGEIDQYVNCPPIVHEYRPRRYCILGGESSGKTTLSRALAKALTTVHVPEYGRTLSEERELYYEDMEEIAERQIMNEKFYESYGETEIICDTSPLTTLFYSNEMFHRASDLLFKMSKRKYYRTFLLDPNIPFEQDGTRRDENFRMKAHNFYLGNLQNPVIISGTLEERVQKCKEIIESDRILCK